MLQLKLHNYTFSLTKRFQLPLVQWSFIKSDQASKCKDATTSSNIYEGAFLTK